jgi:hypothetical protein
MTGRTDVKIQEFRPISVRNLNTAPGEKLCGVSSMSPVQKRLDEPNTNQSLQGTGDDVGPGLWE